jgi:hypothetical protein
MASIYGEAEESDDESDHEPTPEEEAAGDLRADIMQSIGM